MELSDRLDRHKETTTWKWEKLQPRRGIATFPLSHRCLPQGYVGQGRARVAARARPALLHLLLRLPVSTATLALTPISRGLVLLQLCHILLSPILQAITS